MFQRPPRVRFGEFEIDEHAGELRKEGIKVRLQEQPLQILQILLDHPGEVVTREDLRKRVWPTDTFVDFDHGINNAIKRLREALGDTAETPRFVETLPRRGYRFIANLQTAKPVANTIQSIAVLPLENLSRDPEQEYFADGLTEALITMLAKIGDLRVVSRTSAMQYKGVHKSLREIARELEVDTVVEGTVLRVGGRIRITAQLINAANESHLWAESYERNLRDVLALQSEIARAIAREIQIKLTPQEHAQLSDVHPVDPDAYEAYLKGRYFWNKRSGNSLGKASEFFRQAVQKDPNYAAAYSGLADCASSAGWFAFLNPEEGFGKGRMLARKALEMDRSLGEAHASLGWALTYYDYDFVSAEREYERSIELNPRYATAHQWFGLLLAPLGRFDEAFTEFKRAIRLDPLSPIIHAAFSWAYYCAHLYREAKEQAERTLDLDTNFTPGWYALGAASMLNGEEALGLSAFQRAVDLSSGAGAYLSGIGWAFAKLGRKDDANAILDQLLKRRAELNYVMALQIAIIYAELHDKHEALRWLENAYEERSAWMVYLKTDARFDSLRSEARFCELMRKMNFS
jgi:TolB-like protein/Tfp pilus assembly protein PilF